MFTSLSEATQSTPTSLQCFVKLSVCKRASELFYFLKILSPQV